MPVTVIHVEPNRVTQLRDTERDGYRAYQVTTGTRRASRVSKPEAGHLAKADGRKKRAAANQPTGSSDPSVLFLFDEPTTGLHFDDISKLLMAFERLLGDGHSLVVIEHNLDVIQAADWIIDLGPEGGEAQP